MTWTKLEKEVGARAAGSYRQHVLEIPPSIFRETFGRPNYKAFKGKIDREWVFENEDGELFFVYAYKATSAYDRDLPDPEIFWNQKEPYPLRIGGHSPKALRSFLDFLYEEFGNRKNRRRNRKR